MMLSPNRGSEAWGRDLDLLSPEDNALVELGNQLRESNYQFITITPATHQRVIGRRNTSTSALRRVFGWSQPFDQSELPANIISLLHQADELDSDGKLLRSRVRVSTLDGQLFMHSAFPTSSGDAVFFGPDTYRFARALRQALAEITPADPFTIVDVGCGSGAGGVHAARLLRGRADVEVVLSDINPKALRYSRINAAINGVSNVTTVLSNVFDRIDEAADLIISNPPYLVDRTARLYRHGGDNWGCDLSIRIVQEGVDRLQPGGRLLLYTGAPVTDGVDVFFAAIRPWLDARHCEYVYEEIDPDVFGEELDGEPYDRADRIAAVALTIDFPKEYGDG